MQATIRLTADELPNLIVFLKEIFKRDNISEITVTAAPVNNLERKESREEYWAKLEKRLKNLDEGKNLVSFTGEEFEGRVAERREKYGKKK